MRAGLHLHTTKFNTSFLYIDLCRSSIISWLILASGLIFLFSNFFTVIFFCILTTVFVARFLQKMIGLHDTAKMLLSNNATTNTAIGVDDGGVENQLCQNKIDSQQNVLDFTRSENIYIALDEPRRVQFSLLMGSGIPFTLLMSLLRDRKQTLSLFELPYDIITSYKNILALYVIVNADNYKTIISLLSIGYLITKSPDATVLFCHESRLFYFIFSFLIVVIQIAYSCYYPTLISRVRELLGKPYAARLNRLLEAFKILDLYENSSIVIIDSKLYLLNRECNEQ